MQCHASTHSTVFRVLACIDLVHAGLDQYACQARMCKQLLSLAVASLAIFFLLFHCRKQRAAVKQSGDAEGYSAMLVLAPTRSVRCVDTILLLFLPSAAPKQPFGWCIGVVYSSGGYVRGALALAL